MKIKNTLTLSLLVLIMTFSNLSFAQTNVFDDVIATSSNHTYLEAALLQEGLDAALRQNPSCTVFAPDDNAFNNLASALGVTISDLLALPNLSDILIYHVLNSTVLSTGISNGAVVSPLSTTNTLKLTKTSAGDVYVNHSQVSTADITADNGVVHVVSELLLPDETVADIAIDNGFTTLVTAVIQEELLPVLTNPTSSLTVFAPSDSAFDELALKLGVTINDILALPNLSDILTYHVIGSEVVSSTLTNGQIVQPVSTTNTIKISVNNDGVFANQSKVTTADITSDNGVVHVINEVVLPSETVIDVAIDNGFTSLTAAVIQEGLLSTLTNPHGEFTVFAPTDAAFDDLAIALNTNLSGVLANPDLTNILLYHTLDSKVLSSDLSSGSVTTLNGQDFIVDLTMGVMINDANVTTADVLADNGVVHILDKVLLPPATSTKITYLPNVSIYPNPSSNYINIQNIEGEYSIINMIGNTISKGTLRNNKIDISNFSNGVYIVKISNQKNNYLTSFIKE
jgi:transforming growth factor-beta-induced protein